MCKLGECSELAEDLTEIAKESARSTFWLTIGQGFSSTLGAIIIIYIARALQSELFGLYSISLIPVNIGAIIASLGIPSAVTTFVARDIRKDPLKASKWLSTGFILELFNGLVISTIIYFSSSQISEVFLGKPEAAPYVAIASFLVLFIALFGIGYGALNSMYLTKYIAFSQIIGGIVRASLTIYLIYIGYGVFGAIVGFISYYIVASSLEMIFILVELKRYKISFSLGGFAFIKGLMAYGVPLAAASVLQTLGVNIISGLTSQYEELEVLGNYFAANSLMVILIIFNQPILQALIPSFSRVSNSNMNDTGVAFSASITMSALLVSPIIFLVMGLSEPIIFFLFGEGYGLAVKFLMFLPLAFMPTVLGLTSSSSLLLGSGKTREIFLLGSVSLFFSLLSGYILIPLYGAWGLILSIGVLNYSLLILYLMFIRKSFGFKPNFNRLVRIIFASFLMFLVLRAYIRFLFDPLHLFLVTFFGSGIFSRIFSYLIIDIIGGVIGVVSYLSFLIVVRGLTLRDIDVLMVVVEKLGPIRKPFIIIFSALRRIIGKFS